MLGFLVVDYLCMLKDEGLGLLFGIVVEILYDDICWQICFDKLIGVEWFGVVWDVYWVGFFIMLMIMYGYFERLEYWVYYLCVLWWFQVEIGGFMEFVLLLLVYMEVLMYCCGQSCKGFSWCEVLMMYSVVWLVLYGQIDLIQCLWVKFGVDGVVVVFVVGVNDFGGVLMNESISCVVGVVYGQEIGIYEFCVVVGLVGCRLW